jgi:uncharacterized membrane protein
VAGAAVLVLYLALIFIFYGHTAFYHLYSSAPGSYVRYEKATVIDVAQNVLHQDPVSGLELGYQTIRIRILTGQHKGEIVTVKNTLSYSNNVLATAGSGVIACIDTANKTHYDVWIYSYNRGPFLYLIIMMFMVLLCAIGGSRGIRSVLGIIFTFTGIVFLFIPMLYRGYSPALAATGVVMVTLCVALVLLGGFSTKTLAAILGTMAGVVISELFLIAALRFTHLTGYSTNEADSLIQIAGNTHLQVSQLLFAAILISSLGAVMDIAISIASAVNEVYANNNSLGMKELFHSGMNVGRDMMGTMANTLIIAFTGTSLNMLILFYSMNVTYYQLLNNNLVGIYIIEAVSGSIAVVLTVPLVSLISANLIPALASGTEKQVEIKETVDH